MPGFFVSDQQTAFPLKNRYPERCASEEMTHTGATVKGHTLNKFMEDKTFTRTDELIIAEGCLLNKTELLVPDMKHLYAAGNFSEKSEVLTILAAVKLYFGEVHE